MLVRQWLRKGAWLAARRRSDDTTSAALILGAGAGLKGSGGDTPGGPAIKQQVPSRTSSTGFKTAMKTVGRGQVMGSRANDVID